MAALALTLGGAALGASLLPGGVSVLGATISGAAIGGAIGGIAGSAIDAILFAPTSPTVKNTGPRLDKIPGMASTEGAPILRAYGRVRVSTQVIWTAKFREEVVTKRRTQGGKGGGPSVTTETTTYLYFASFALGLCEGPILGIGRIWADGKRLRRRGVELRLYHGTEDQEPDPKIEAVQGEGKAPAYRGLAYLVFEEMPLERYGNRIPQITVEIFRPANRIDSLENLITAVALIPGTTEFGYDTRPVYELLGDGVSRPENRHVEGTNETDVEVAIEQLLVACPHIEHVSLVVSWHGTDLRVGECEIVPKVEFSNKKTRGGTWRVSGINRNEAEVVSRLPDFPDVPAIGGAPSDRSVFNLIEELNDRGLKVTLYPFIMMDIPEGNELPDPYGGTEQARYPWRGRITCHPARGQPGTVDKTGAAATQVAAFFGDADPGDFAWDANLRTVAYSGPDEWSFRRLILHYATLAEAAGGVDAFLIGTEMVGLTTIRSDADSYPAVAHLKDLAADVRSILGSETKIGYAADWTEYGNHRPADGTGDVFFHLDPLWSDANIDFVGIDAYFPLADWRDGNSHLDAAVARSLYQLSYLKNNIEGGELFDWYYEDFEAREEQDRTPITDGAYDEPWVHRIKDVRSWWANAHHDRPGGVRDGSPTNWVPEGKPIRFTEVGCPAIDKGANQPNTFVDPKSVENLFPYFSTGTRDDAMQRAYLEAVLGYWASDSNNPESSEYSGRMIARGPMAVWCWDARPYPEFPDLADLWADAGNWRLGHWINGRLGQTDLAAIVEEIAGGLGVEIDTTGLFGMVKGYIIDRIMSAREAIAPLGTAYSFDGAESDGTIIFVHRNAAPAMTFQPRNLVAPSGEPASGFKLTRAQESELPRSAKLKFIDRRKEYRVGAVETRRLVGNTARVDEFDLPLVFNQGEAQGICDGIMAETHAARERLEVVLPPAALGLDATDVIRLQLADRTLIARVTRIGWEWARPAEALRIDDGPLRRRTGREDDDGSAPPLPSIPGPSAVAIMDLPLLDSGDAGHAPYLAAYADPWEPVAVWRAESDEPPVDLDTILTERAAMGTLAFDFYSGPVWRWDRVNDLYVDLPAGQTLVSATERQVLDGANAGAVQTPSGAWEIVQWQTATLVAPGRYRLSLLLRGQLGTEHIMGSPTPAGARFVLLDGAVRQSAMPSSAVGAPLLWSWGPADLDPEDEAYDSDVLTMDGVGLRSYAPVQVRGEIDHEPGDWHLGFVRRTRIDGDSWEQTEVPLAEDAEEYVLEILDGEAGPVLRTVDLSAPSFVYTAAMQTADFGELQWNLFVRVAQVSRVTGAGAAATAFIWDH